MSRDLLVNAETGERSLGRRQSSPLHAINTTIKNLVRWSDRDGPSVGEGRSSSSEAAHRLQPLPQYVQLLPIIFMIVLSTILAFQSASFTLLTKDIFLWEHVAFWQTWVTFIPMMLTIQFHSCMQVAKDLWTQLERADSAHFSCQKDDLVKKSRTCVWAVDGSHAVLIIAFWLTLRSFQSVYFWVDKERVGYVVSMVSLSYVCVSTTLFVNMRATLFQYDMLNEQFKQIRERSFGLILIQLALGMYVAVKATGMFPFTKEIVQSLRENQHLPPEVCGEGVTFNASYFEIYCDYQWERMSSGNDGLNRICNDGGWERFRSRYDACRSASMVFSFYVDAYSAHGISMNFYLWHVFFTVARIRERDSHIEKIESRTLLARIQYAAVGLGLVISTLSAMLYCGSLFAIRSTGIVAEYVYDQYVDLVNIGAWLLTYFFINLELCVPRDSAHTPAHPIPAASVEAPVPSLLSTIWVVSSSQDPEEGLCIVPQGAQSSLRR